MNDLMAKTINNNKATINGLFYRDCVVDTWFIITDSFQVFTELNGNIRHQVTAKKPATKGQIDNLLNCDLDNFLKQVI